MSVHSVIRRYRLTIGGEEEMRCVLLWQPSDFVNFLFDL